MSSRVLLTAIAIAAPLLVALALLLTTPMTGVIGSP